MNTQNSKKDNEPAFMHEDADLVALDRVLTQAADIVFPLPPSLPEATDQEIDQLMKMTAKVRRVSESRRLMTLIRSYPAKLLALAASFFALMGGGLFYSLTQRAVPCMSVAMAMPSGLVFRGGEDIPGAVESGVLAAATNLPAKATTDFLRMEQPISADKSGSEIAALLSNARSRNVLYVTEDQAAGKLVLIVFERKTGRRLAETRINTGDAEQVQINVSSTVAGWIQNGLL
jgi:hypothetical protein